MSKSEMLPIVGNIKSIRALAKEMSVAEFAQLVDKFNLVLKERKEAKAAETEARIEKDKKLDKYISELKRQGLNVDDLLDRVTRVKNKKKSPPPKYSLVVDGETKLWNGSGKKPRYISEFLASGGNLDDILIKKNN